MGNPVRYDDPKGDTPTWGPALVAAGVAFAVDLGFQAAKNVANGKPINHKLNFTSAGISAGAAFTTVLTVGLINPVTSVGAVAVGVTVSGAMGAGESATKQVFTPETGADGNPVPFSTSKVATDAAISAATGGHSETSQQIYKTIANTETAKKVGEFLLNAAGEFTENANQNIVQSIVEQSNRPKPKPKPLPVETDSKGIGSGGLHMQPANYPH